MKFYIVYHHHADAQEHYRKAFTDKRDAVREAKEEAAEAIDEDCYEWYFPPTVYRVTTDGTKREVMELVAGSRYHGKWEVVWEADWYGRQ